MFLLDHGEAPRTGQHNHHTLYYFTQEDGKPQGTDLKSFRLPCLSAYPEQDRWGAELTEHTALTCPAALYQRRGVWTGEEGLFF